MDYAQAWSLQHQLVEEHKAGRGQDILLLVEHPPTLTMGRRAKPENLLSSEPILQAAGIQRYEVERGGDVTYHGPGQLVAYPILDLRNFRKDVRWLSASLGESARLCLDHFGIQASYQEGDATGLWLDDRVPAAKIAALGLRIERWICYHGLALNVEPDLSHFEHIIPCGLEGIQTTSMAEALQTSISIETVIPHFIEAFGTVFERQMIPSVDLLELPLENPLP